MLAFSMKHSLLLPLTQVEARQKLLEAKEKEKEEEKKAQINEDAPGNNQTDASLLDLVTPYSSTPSSSCLP